MIKKGLSTSVLPMIVLGFIAQFNTDFLTDRCSLSFKILQNEVLVPLVLADKETMAHIEKIRQLFIEEKSHQQDLFIEQNNSHKNQDQFKDNKTGHVNLYKN